MKAEDLLLLGGAGLALYLIYQTASSAADLVPNVVGAAGGAIQSGIQALSTAAGAVKSGVQTVAAAPSIWNCADSYMSSLMPFGTGALSVPDSYVVACSGGVTVGSLRAANLSNEEIIQYIAALECSCAAAQLPGSGVKVQGNVIVPGVSGYRHRLPAGVVWA